MIYIPTDERAVTDAEVFAAFDLSLPGLAGVASALAAGDLPTAKTALVRYFETRANVRYSYDYRALPLRPMDTDTDPYQFQASMGLQGSLKDFCLFSGEKLLQHIYVRPGRERRELDLGPHYEKLPHYNYFKDQGIKSRATLDIFVRGVFWEYLAILYHETGREDVPAFAEEFLHLFWQNYPLLVECTAPDTSHFSLTEERDVMSAGWLAMNYLSLLYTRLPYKLAVGTAFDIIKHLWFLGMQFRRFDADSYRKYNHHMWERGLVPFLLGTLLPEIPAFVAMRDRGAEVVRMHIRDDFNEAGGYSEHSIPYWCGAALGEMICYGIQIARLNGTALLDPDTKSRISKSYDVLAQIAAPGQLFPSIGDNGGPLVEPVLQSGVSALENPLCRAALDARHGRGTAGGLPLDYCNDRVGFFCTKSSHGTDANYLLMSAKVDCGTTGHNHMDMLSLCLSIRGQEIIGEPYARAIYHGVAVGNAPRGYMYNMSSHNTVLVYGQPVQPDAIYNAKWGVLRPDSPVRAFATAPQGCYVRATHDAYTHCRCQRSVLASRRKGFLISDVVLGGNRLQAPHLQRWHLMPGVVCTQLDHRTLLLEQNGARALLRWCGSPTLRLYRDEFLSPLAAPAPEQLALTIDAAFQEEGFIPAGGLEPVCQRLLVLDATDTLPSLGDADELCAQMESLAQGGQLDQALALFEQIG